MPTSRLAPATPPSPATPPLGSPFWSGSRTSCSLGRMCCAPRPSCPLSTSSANAPSARAPARRSLTATPNSFYTYKMDGTMTLKIGAVTLGWKGTSLPETLAQLRAMGGECVELNSGPGVHPGLILTREMVPQVRHWIEQSGLVLGSVSGYNDFGQTDPDAMRAQGGRLLAACRFAADLGVP